MEQDAVDASKMMNMSTIDWSIFRDGEDDAFGWLLRTNMGLSLSNNAEITRTPTPTDCVGSMDVLPLDDINIALEPPSLLGMNANFHATQIHANVLTNSMECSLTAPGAISPDPLNGVTSINDLASRLTTAAATATSQQAQQKATSNQKLKQPAKAIAASTTPQADTRLKRKRSSADEYSNNSDEIPEKEEEDDEEEEEEEEEEEDEEMEKKRIRRLKNLESVREFRKRKMKQLEQNEAKLKRLEAENLDLKMRLKIGKEALRSEQEEKNQIKQQLKEMLQHKAPEKEIARFLEMYRINYSDYGPKRREKLRFHLSRIRELLLPTEVTRICLNSVDQGIETVVNTETTGGKASSLWAILAKELEVSEEQQAEILKKRSMIKQLRADLAHSLDILNRLEQVTEEKNTALETAVVLLQGILTPTQSSKFILWVKNNPAFMYMLDRLVDISLMAPGIKNDHSKAREK